MFDAAYRADAALDFGYEVYKGTQVALSAFSA